MDADLWNLFEMEVELRATIRKFRIVRQEVSRLRVARLVFLLQRAE